MDFTIFGSAHTADNKVILFLPIFQNKHRQTVSDV